MTKMIEKYEKMIHSLIQKREDNDYAGFAFDMVDIFENASRDNVIIGGSFFS